MGEVIRLPDGRAAQYWDNGVAGPAVLFFHGCPDTRHAAMTGASAAKALGVRLVAVNRPGYGRSDRHPSTQSSVADDAVAAADALGIDRFAALGMSVGTAYALVCAARHPDRVRALALVAGPDDEALARRFLDDLPPADAALLGTARTPAQVAASVREALVTTTATCATRRSPSAPGTPPRPTSGAPSTPGRTTGPGTSPCCCRGGPRSSPRS
ncbi:alpha/beta fold hydrolase [Nocardioides sp.]|uniref:alpha/beta fold hydrolase n=1 Tax=Nocardioides sp. TaxID=35761 RepID=UPI0037844384